jgi:hypothetical protein
MEIYDIVINNNSTYYGENHIYIYICIIIKIIMSNHPFLRIPHLWKPPNKDLAARHMNGKQSQKYPREWGFHLGVPP